MIANLLFATWHEVWTGVKQLAMSSPISRKTVTAKISNKRTLTEQQFSWTTSRCQWNSTVRCPLLETKSFNYNKVLLCARNAYVALMMTFQRASITTFRYFKSSENKHCTFLKLCLGKNRKRSSHRRLMFNSSVLFDWMAYIYSKTQKVFEDVNEPQSCLRSDRHNKQRHWEVL